MSDITFAEGDVVRLKSGGPKMTITQIGPVQGTTNIPVRCATCIWFDRAGVRYEEVLPESALEPVI